MEKIFAKIVCCSAFNQADLTKVEELINSYSERGILKDYKMEVSMNTVVFNITLNSKPD